MKIFSENYESIAPYLSPDIIRVYEIMVAEPNDPLQNIQMIIKMHELLGSLLHSLKSQCENGALDNVMPVFILEHITDILDKMVTKVFPVNMEDYYNSYIIESDITRIGAKVTSVLREIDSLTKRINGFIEDARVNNVMTNELVS